MKSILPIILGAVSLNLTAQNWVPNYSFDNYINCPSNYNQVGFCQFWQPSPVNNVPGYHTEFLHACNGGTFSVPSSTWGNQTAVSGQGYMALCTMAPSVAVDYRENIYVPLISPLTVGQTYYVSFKVSHTDASQFASNNIGAKFSTVPNISVNNFAHVNSATVITDKVNWVTVSGSFTADSAYSFLGIGNFFTDANTQSSNICGCQFPLHGYFIDEVCVFREVIGNCSLPYSPATVENLDNLAIKNVLITPNPSTEGSELTLFIPEWNSLYNRVKLFDVTGKMVQEFNDVVFSNGVAKIKPHITPPGIYFVRVESLNIIGVGKLIFY